ncbi:MAG: hypothetical protein ACOC3Y_01775 [Desulfohalobiaceae bacterium]
MIQNTFIDYTRQPGGEYVWIIQSPYYFLDKFCLTAGLQRDSAIPLVYTLDMDPFAEARLTYPGAKCPDPEPWLKVLALLYLHYVPFSLYQGLGSEQEQGYLIRLKPSIDQELLDILGFAAREKIRELQRCKALLRKAFALLNRMHSAG